MSVIGVDLGSFRTVIAGVVRGGVEIFANESSYRETKNMVGYGKGQRQLGDSAASKYLKNYKNTAVYFTRLLGCEFGTEEYNKEKQFIASKLVAGGNNETCYKLNHHGENITLSPSQVLASHFNKVVQVLEMNNIQNREFVITIPGYLTINERQSILAAGDIAGVKIVVLVEESECNVKNYGIFRRKDLTEEKRLVAFVDFGHSKTSVYFAEITNKEANIVYEESNRHLGARDLDKALYGHFRDAFQEQSGCNVDENPKSKIRLLQGIERCRKVLSANADANLNVEFLMDDEDFSCNITREYFETLGQATFGQFRELVRTALHNSGINPNTLHSVEILGGPSRIPMIQQIICEELKQKEVSKTLDLSESCARGAAIKAAEKSPNFQVAEFSVKSINKHAIKCNYLMFKASEGEVKELTGTLFKKGVKLPSTMSVSVGKTQQSKLQVFYDDPVPARASKEIFNIETNHFNPKEQDFKLILRAVLNEAGIPYFKNADLEEYYIEEVKKPIEKKKDEKKMDVEKPAEGEEDKPDEGKMEEEEVEYEIKKVKKTRISHIKWKNTTPPLFPMSTLQALKGIEQEMMNNDNSIVATDKARNDLETKIYKAKGEVTESWSAFINPDEIRTINETADTLEAWLYDEGMSTTRAIYEEKLAILNSLCQPVEDRLTGHKGFRESAGYLQAKLQQYTGKIENEKDKFSHLNEEDRTNYNNLMAGAHHYSQELNQKLSSINLKQSPPVLSETVYKFTNDFERNLEKILGKPKPAPPKPEKKEEPVVTETPKDGGMEEEAADGTEHKESGGMDVE